MSEVILGKRKLKGKHVSIHLRSRRSYSDRNIPRDEQGSSISSSRLMKHFYRWRFRLFYSVLTNQLLFQFVEWAYSQGNQALYSWCLRGSLNGHIHRVTQSVLVMFPRVLERSGLSHATFTACDCPKSVDEFTKSRLFVSSRRTSALAWSGEITVVINTGVGRRGETETVEDIPANLHCLFNLI